jgi:ketosteroid isomerase-like protein
MGGTMVEVDGGTEMAHPNADLLRKGYHAFSNGDLDTIRNDVFSPDILLHVAGRNPLSGDYRGVERFSGSSGRSSSSLGEPSRWSCTTS